MGNVAFIKRKTRYTWMFIGWISLSFVWIRLGATGCLTIYRADYSEIINYSDLLDQHSRYDSLLVHPLFALVVAIIVGIVLLVKAKRRWPGLLLIPLAPFACLMLLGGLSCDDTTLKRMDTIEFDNRIYHLTHGYDSSSDWEDFSYVLILYECELDGETCRGREIERSYLGDFRKPKLNVDLSAYQLRVIADNHVLLTLDANPRPTSIPINREAIQLENINRPQDVAHFQYDPVVDLTWSHDGKVLAASGYDAIWLHRFQAAMVSTEILPVQVGTGFWNGSSRIAFSPNQNLLAIALGNDRSVQIWDIDNLSQESNFPFSNADDVTFSSDGRLFATAKNGEIIVFDSANLTELVAISDMQGSAIDELAFSLDGQLIASSGYDYKTERDFVKAWNIQSKEEVFTLEGLSSFFSIELAFAPDNRHLTFSTSEELNPGSYPAKHEVRLHMWDLQQNSERFSVVVPADIYEISDLVWTLNGDMIVSVDHGDKITFWNAETGELLEALDGLSAGLDVLALSPDGTLLAVGANDGTIRIWGVPSDE